MAEQIEVEVEAPEVGAVEEALDRLAAAVTEVREAWAALPEEVRAEIGMTLGELVEEQPEIEVVDEGE